MSALSRQARAKRGFTLTEAAIVLGIVGLILSAIWVAAASVYNNFRVSKSSEQLLTIVQQIRSMHATQSTVDTSISAVNVAKAGGVPNDMTVVSGGQITEVRDIWGGDVTIGATSYNGIAGAAFYIQYEDVPQPACIELLVRNTGTGRDTGLVGAGTSVSTGTSFPVTVTTAAGLCGSATDNTIVFTFRLKG